MKRLFFSTALALTVSVAAAQTGGGTTAGNNSARSGKALLSTVSTNDEVRRLATQMQLNEGQYIILRDLNRAKTEQIREINNMYANDAATRQAKLVAANQAFEKQLAQSVSQSQYSAYLAALGRAPEATPGSIHQAGGYGGRSLESGAATGTSINGGAVSSDDGTNTNVPVNQQKRNKKEKVKNE
ncbi:MAG: hypothetical protein JWQ14_552 [Adhaeribacter sp.]|nr:hypothetical protein [Adhaeribacter sp.]